MTPEQAFIRALLTNEAALRAYEYACAVNLRYDPGQIQAALHRALRALGASGPDAEARPESAREMVRRLTAEACAEVRAAIGDEWGSRPLREGIGEMRRRMIAAENAVAAYRKRDAEQGPAVVAGEAPIAHSTWPRTSTADALMALRGAERDVATDPRVGDRVTVGGWLRTVEAVEPGRILVYSGPRFYWRPEEWAFLCQMPGAVIERAEDPPPRDVARSPKVGDRITINEAGERTTYEVQGFPEEGIACWASADGRPIGPCVVSPARWKAACGEGSGAVIERAPE